MFTQKEIAKMPMLNVSADRFLSMSRKINPDIPFNKKDILRLDNGAFLGIYKNKEDKWFRLHLKTIWIKHFNLSYRTTKTKDGKERVGKELIISNMPLPRGPVV